MFIYGHIDRATVYKACADLVHRSLRKVAYMFHKFNNTVPKYVCMINMEWVYIETVSGWMQPESCHDANFVVIGGTRVCRSRQ